jgi:hydroxymethylpyrimidine/phosphomethylpyrimidine kinase
VSSTESPPFLPGRSHPLPGDGQRGAELLAIGGFDPGGGAGLIRDYYTATALGARIFLVGTAWTDQSPRGVAAVEPRAAAAVRAAIITALDSGTDAVKVGMVATPALAEEIAAALEGFAGPVVFDPVLAASSGGSLFAGPPAALDALVRRAWLVTPNLAEAAALAGSGAVRDLEGARAAAEAIRARGARAVLVKGGHLEGSAADLLVTATGAQTFSAERVPGKSPRGTGCALATALAVELARGRPLPEAVAAAKAWLHARILQAHDVGDERHLS